MENIVHFIAGIPSAVLPLIVLLGLLIFVHELGHFMVARWCGVRVETFSFGFGKKLLQYKKGDTTYCVSMFPLGGYVKMYGENNADPIPDDEKAYSFTHKTLWQRIAIVLAGPIMNLIFAVFIFLCVVMVGEDMKPAVVGDVKVNTAAYQVGFRSGDKIVSVNGKPVTTWEDVGDRMSQVKGLQAEVRVAREGTGTEESLQPEIKIIKNPNPLSLESHIGDIEGLTPVSEAALIGVKPGSLADTLGFKTGDQIKQVNGKKIFFYRDLAQAFKDGPRFKIEVARVADNKKSEDLSFDFEAKGDSLEALGFESSSLYIAQVFKDTPAAKAGLETGDKFFKINGAEMKTWEQVLQTIKSSSDKEPLSVAVLRGKEEKTFSIVPEVTSQMGMNGLEEKRFAIGVRPLIEITTVDSIIIRTLEPVEAIVKAVHKTWDVTVMTIMGFVRMFQGQISPKSLGGFISIGQVAHDSFQIGLTHFFQMMAIISINLFAINLLPVPMLDGGHLLFYTIELVTGSPLSFRKMEIAQQIGFALLMSLMMFALFNDFSRFFQSM